MKFTHVLARRMPFIVPVLALCAGLALPATASAKPGMELALQDDAVFVGRFYYDRDRAFQNLNDLGVTQLRVNVVWRNVSPSPRSRRSPRSFNYNFWQYDDVVNHAAAYGIRVQMVLTGPAPRWAAGKRNGVYKPKASRFAGFTRAAAAHFRGRVSRYSIWNEPNHPGWLQPLRSAARLYRSLYSAGYRGVKSQDPGAQVLFGELAPYGRRGGSAAQSPLTFLRKATCSNGRFTRRRCKGLRADGFAHHPYDFVRPPHRRNPDRAGVTMANLGKLTKVLSRLRRTRALRTPQGGVLPLYLTEFGYLRKGRKRLRESKRASYLLRAYRMARKNRKVQQMTHYLLVTPTSRWAFFDTSLINRKGSPYRSYRTLRSFGR
jgi:hypothetical protein